MSGMKNLVKRILRWMLTPVRRQSVRRNGAVDTTGRISLPNEHLLPLVAEALEQGHTATIWVKGFSMRPFLEHERDRVKLAYPQQVQVGDAVLARIAPGHYVLHRIVHRDGNLLTLQGDGNLRGVEECCLDDVCGVVTEYIRPGRTIMADDPGLCRRIWLWRRLRPVRRLLLLFYKATLP